MSGERFPRSWRLASASDFRTVLQRGHRARTPRLDLFWHPNHAGHPRLGLIVPLHGETAVARNRLRRRLREIARRSVLPRLPPLDLVVRSRADAYRAALAELRVDLERWQYSLAG